MPELLHRPLPERPRILLVRLSALGDVVFALPALRALRKMLPKAQLEWLTEDRHEGLLADHPDLDSLHIFPRRSGFGASLKALRTLRDTGPFDAILDFQGNFKSALHLLPLAASRKIGFDRKTAREMAHLFVHERVSIPPQRHRSRRDFQLVEQFARCTQLELPTLNLQKDGGPWPIQWNAPMDESPEETAPLVLLHTGFTHYGRDKAWPKHAWTDLALELADRGLDVQLLHTPSDLAMVSEMADSTGAAARLAPPTTGIPELMALCDRAQLLIGTDSGPLHLAAWRGTPALGLFGPTDPAVYGPIGARTSWVSALPDGETPPARQRNCRSPLMDALLPEKVIQAASLLL